MDLWGISWLEPLLKCYLHLNYSFRNGQFISTYSLEFKESIDRQPRPIWPKIVNTFEAEPPASKIARQRRKLPAGNFVPGMKGWLCHVLFGLGYLGLLQLLVTTASVPTCWTSTIGLSACSYGRSQRATATVTKNTMCLGSVRRFVPFTETL